MLRCAVLGDPIAHSLSPVLHRAGYAAVGIQGEYDAHRVDELGLAGFLEGLDESWRGLSLTMPLKRAVMALVPEVSEVARLAGGANTLVRRDDGSWRADNTDVPGAVAAIRERYVGSPAAATVLGGGATATSVGLALADLGVGELQLLVRSPERAAETVAALARHPRAPLVRVATLAEGRATGEVVVSTIPAAAQTPDLVERCAGAAVVFEVVYHPWPTPLAAGTHRSGQVLVGGLDLLVHQAALQFAQFTGVEAPLTAMRRAGEEELAARSARAPGDAG
ncbi:shikimate dehydrogenase [Nocardioides alcanivorans]|uniref:shikimate dehydrogenase n=1 Tax=Nocardioides alcanivorans TaxID=2897352 RepID=UPI001F32E24F|nr:shikimate dehydrogenase [Nocardioides alcanivorans]